MAFYIGQVGNPNVGFEDIREYFLNSTEVEEFKNRIAKGREKVINLRVAQNLAELLIETSYGYSTRKELIETTRKNYLDLVNRFGIALLNKHFPNESINDNLFNQIEKLNIEDQNDTSEDHLKDEHLENRYNPEFDAGESEIQRWDNEDPSWRIANDLD